MAGQEQFVQAVRKGWAQPCLIGTRARVRRQGTSGYVWVRLGSCPGYARVRPGTHWQGIRTTGGLRCTHAAVFFYLRVRPYKDRVIRGFGLAVSWALP